MSALESFLIFLPYLSFGRKSLIKMDKVKYCLLLSLPSPNLQCTMR